MITSLGFNFKTTTQLKRYKNSKCNQSLWNDIIMTKRTGNYRTKILWKHPNRNFHQNCPVKPILKISVHRKLQNLKLKSQNCSHHKSKKIQTNFLAIGPLHKTKDTIGFLKPITVISSIAQWDVWTEYLQACQNS